MAQLNPDRATSHEMADQDTPPPSLLPAPPVSRAWFSRHYKKLKVLGEGSYGEVSLYRKRDTRELVVIKKIQLKSQIRSEEFMMNHLSSLDPDECNFVKLYSSFQMRGKTYLVFEKLDISLYDYIMQTQQNLLPLDGLRSIAQQFATTLKALMSVNVIHGDLNLDNIMLVDHVNKPFRVKFKDFGLSLLRSDDRPGCLCQTIWYRAPEVVLGLPFDEAVDMWSVGCILAKLATGIYLFPANYEYDLMQYMIELLGYPEEHLLDAGRATRRFFYRSEGHWKLMFNLNKDDRNNYEDCMQFVDLVQRMLKMDPSVRITPSEVLAHPFITRSHLASGPLSSHVVRTPLNSVQVKRKRRSSSKSYRQSYRSCLGAASHLGLTPRLTARRLITSRRAPKSCTITEKVSPEQLALLVKEEWQLSYVTPLYQFRYTQLKNYSRRLSAFIAAERQQGLAVEVEGSDGGFRASFSVLQGMAETDDDAETVLVQIHSKPLFAGQDVPQKLVWSGWLTCINGSTDYLHSLPKDFVCLPLLCSSGAGGLTSLVKSWFQQAFDCCFGPLEINSTNLEWLAALWTNCHGESNIQQLKLIWTLPVAPPLDINYTVHSQDAWDLWRSVRKKLQEDSEGRGGRSEGEEEEEGSIGIEEVTRFMQGLKRHFYRHFRIDLAAGRLKQVSTALGSAKHSGRIKISNSSYMITTMTLLTECALLKMPI
ncbi:centromere protein L [Diretmus argenteus]